MRMVYINRGVLSRMHPRFLPLQGGIMQLSDAWFKQRRGRLTGSKLSNFCFIKNEDEYHEYYGIVYEGKPKPPFSEQALGYMKYGREHEDVAVVSFLNDAPADVGDIYIAESPFYKHTEPTVGASPDGTYAIYENGKIAEEGVIEIKCPGKAPNTPYSKWKYYYVPQTYWEMSCSGHTKTIAISWGPRNMRAWKYEWDESYWNILCNIVEGFSNHVPYSEFLNLQADLVEASHRVANSAKALHPDKGWKQYAHKVENIKKHLVAPKQDVKKRKKPQTPKPKKPKLVDARSFSDFGNRDMLWAEVKLHPETRWFKDTLPQQIESQADHDREFVVMKCEEKYTLIPGYSSSGKLVIGADEKVILDIKFFE
mgnify:CR=1 FL=1